MKEDLKNGIIFENNVLIGGLGDEEYMENLSLIPVVKKVEESYISVAEQKSYSEYPTITLKEIREVEKYLNVELYKCANIIEKTIENTTFQIEIQHWIWYLPFNLFKKEIIKSISMFLFDLRDKLYDMSFDKKFYIDFEELEEKINIVEKEIEKLRNLNKREIRKEVVMKSNWGF